jgi:hypothetical protein
MLSLYLEDMPLLTALEQRLRRWGNVDMISKQTLRLIPLDPKFPPIYFNQNGLIDVLDSGLDLFEQEDCVERLEQWLGVS